jgi:hypothetical protein
MRLPRAYLHSQILPRNDAGCVFSAPLAPQNPVTIIGALEQTLCKRTNAQWISPVVEMTTLMVHILSMLHCSTI